MWRNISPYILKLNRKRLSFAHITHHFWLVIIAIGGREMSDILLLRQFHNKLIYDSASIIILSNIDCS